MGIGYGLAQAASALAGDYSAVLQGQRAGQQTAFERYVAQQTAQHQQRQLDLAQQNADGQALLHRAQAAALGVVPGTPRPNGVQSLPAAVDPSTGQAPTWGDALGDAEATMPKAYGDIDMGSVGGTNYVFRPDVGKIPQQVAGRLAVVDAQTDGRLQNTELLEGGRNARATDANVTREDIADGRNGTAVRVAQLRGPLRGGAASGAPNAAASRQDRQDARAAQSGYDRMLGHRPLAKNFVNPTTLQPDAVGFNTALTNWRADSTAKGDNLRDTWNRTRGAANAGGAVGAPASPFAGASAASPSPAPEIPRAGSPHAGANPVPGTGAASTAGRDLTAQYTAAAAKYRQALAAGYDPTAARAAYNEVVRGIAGVPASASAP